MSSQYSFAPYQDPPEDIPVHERQQAAFTSPSHYSAEGGSNTQHQEALLGTGPGGDQINLYETGLPLRYVLL